MAVQKPYATGLKGASSINPHDAVITRESFVGGPNYRPDSWTIAWQTKGGADQDANWAGAKTKTAPADDGDMQITGLARNTIYYVRNRPQNSAGNNGWSAAISFRTPAELPSAPTPFYIDAQGQTGSHYQAHASGDDGGTPIREYQVSYSTGSSPEDGTKLEGLQPSGGNIDVFLINLTRHTFYNVWSRARNDIGWGPWSGALGVQTHAFTPAPPSPLTVDNVTQISARFSFRGEDNGGSDILEYQVGYGTDPNSIQTIIGSTGVSDIGGLKPYTTYYFWARARNEEGWGGWSSRSQTRTQAGAKVHIDGSYLDAIPYVKENGVWRVARPYIKRVGLWKTTQ